MAKYIWEQKDWHNFSYDHKRIMKLLARTRLLQGRLLGRVMDLDIKLEKEAQAEVLIEEAVHTAQIEGMLLNQASVRSSVAERLGLPHGVGVVKDKRAEGLIDVMIDAIQFHEKALSIKRLNGWQAALFPSGYSSLKKIRIGKLRGGSPMRVISGPIGKEKIHFEAPPERIMRKELKLFIDWWNSPTGSMDGIIRAAAAHLRFVTIHPYEDGNGRITRAITDMALAQDEESNIRFYSISSQIVRIRDEYYDILENVQNCRVSVTEWFIWFLNALSGAIEDSDRIINNVFLKAEFWKKHAQTSISNKQKKVIQKLLEAGPGGFEGGLTTRKYVGITGVSRVTAYREIKDLKDKGIISYAAGKGRSVHYQLNWE